MTDAPAYTDADAPDEDGHVDREPQWDLIAEQSTLGAMMLAPRDHAVIDEIMGVVNPGDFWNPRHELIAIAIGALHAHGHPTEQVAVIDELERTGALRRAGGMDYVHEVVGATSTWSNGPFYADLVQQHAKRRRLVEAGTRIREMGYSSEGDVDDLLERARNEVDQIESVRRRRIGFISDAFEAVVKSLDGKVNYVRTPWTGLDAIIGGFAPGSLYVIAARPGQGKTIALLQCAARLAHEGTVAFASLEMPEDQLLVRLISQYGPVHMTNLRSHTLSDIDWNSIHHARTVLLDAPIFIDDTAGVTIAQIRAHARAVARRGKLAGIVVDYLQLVHGTGESREREVAEVAQGLKELAKQLNVPVIVAAQLRRGGAVFRGKVQEPTLEDLRESGGIEQAADVVVLMHRDVIKSAGQVKLIVAKNRHGESRAVSLIWQPEFSRLLDKRWSASDLLEDDE